MKFIFLLIYNLMNTDRYLRGKRNSFTINLIQTSQGFSIVEGTELLNKSQGLTMHNQLSSTGNFLSHHSTHLPSRQFKTIYKKTNLIFDAASFNSSTFESKICLHKDSTDVPHDFCTKWFQAESVHEIQTKQVLQWFAEKHKISVQEAEEREDFEKVLRLYEIQRNQIITLYKTEFYREKKYLSANALRKYLSCDAFWIMKIHHFLTSIGIINLHSMAPNLLSLSSEHLFKSAQNSKEELLNFELNTKVKTEADAGDSNKILKELTSNLRPYCDYCRIHCGIVWFQHSRSLDPKQIANIMKNVNSKNPPLSQKQYEYILCIKCYCDNRFPLLLTHHDFKKVSVNDKIDPCRKKKSKHRKREKQKREAEEQNEEEHKLPQEQDRSHPPEEQEIQKKEQVSSVIESLVNNLHRKQWTLEETSHLLSLVDQHGQSWETIHQELQKRGFCSNLETEEIILYFLSLPSRGLSNLVEEYSDEEFIEQNLFANIISDNTRLLQHKIEDSQLFTSSQAQYSLLKKGLEENPWKKAAIRLTQLGNIKIESKLRMIQQCEETVQQLLART